MRIDGTTKIYLGGVEQVKIKQNGVVIWEKQQQDINYFYIENTYQGQNTVSLTTTQSGTPTSGTYATSVEYSKDKSTWTTLTLTAGGSNSITLNSGEKVYFRNNSGYWSVTNDSDNSYVKHTITSTNTIATGGNISSILDYTNMNSVSLSAGCFSRLFYNSTNLTTAPELSYTTLAGNCYREMFKGCTSLTTPPLLPATTLDVRCYQSMFLDCTSLTSAPALPAMSATFGCYNRMFNNCTSLTTAPSLPATTLSDACYSYMFEGCSGLTTAPSLPATTLTLSCYQGMFRNCTNLTTPPQISGTVFSGASVMHEMFRGCSSLTTAPSLPATTLGNDCYRGMFHSCSSLTTAPVLPATTLVTRCYANMFTNCTSLNTVITYANDISATNCIVEWLSGVAATGDFYNFGSATYTTGISGIPTGWTEQTYFYIENTYGGNNTVTITTTQNGSPTSGSYANSVEYSKDKSTWTTIQLIANRTNTISLNQGEKVYLRNNSGKWNTYDGTNNFYNRLSATENHSVGGNINSLVDYNNIGNISGRGVFLSLFSSDSKLTDISNLKLPATTLVDDCYREMFRGTGLTDISSLTLPAMTLTPYCYCAMFENCSNLVTGITSLPATTVADSCYRSMYSNATALTTTPSTLPAETLDTDCYRFMFRNTSITNCPELPAKTLVTRCYQGIFYGCSNLDEVTVYADNNSATDCTLNWLYGVANSGTFNNLGSATYTADSASGIPTGWSVVYNYFYIENTYAGQNTVTLTTTQSGTPTSGTYTTSVEYSNDKSTWTTLSLTSGGTNTISLNQGEKVYFRNNSGVFNYTDDSKSYYTRFDCSEQFDIGGNINTLLDYEHLDNITLPQGCFSRMFINAKIVNASNLKLPSTTLSPHCYRAFLNNCASLITYPELPATTLADKCYYAMFYGCSSLTTFQDKLPATTLVFGCYDSMFRGCSSLSKAPELPAATLANYCYSNMFHSCSNLSEIKIGATSWNSTYSSNWLRDAGSSVLGTKTAYVKTGTTIPTGNSGIPSNWTIVYY